MNLAVAGESARLMDRIYARQRHIYDATRKFFLLGRDSLIADLAVPEGGTVLELGCGTGRNLIKIAQRYPGARCHGLDLSSAMLHTAQASVAKAGLPARIALAEADAASFDPQPLFGVEVFDRVVISYALSMIPPWQAVLRRGAEVLAPGGSLHIVDFGDQNGQPRLFKAALEAWLARFHVTIRPELPVSAAAIATDLGLAAEAGQPFRGYAVRIVIRRHC